MTGFIKKAISGFYYCESEGKLYECRARGTFRKDGISPMAGDLADFTENGEKGIIEKIHPRKNEFTRPPIANLDKLFLVTSIQSPVPSLLVIDKLTAVCEYKGIEPILVITKTDLADCAELLQVYSKAGLKVISLSNLEKSDATAIKSELKDCVSAFIGNTGVGKSSLLNNLFPELVLETGIISKKLGRGKHTTRMVEFFNIQELNARVADTPGFGTVDLDRYEIIKKDELENCFREFAPYLGKCKFTGCSHTSEKGCAVIEACKEHKIADSRFESYVSLYRDAQKRNDWE